MGWVSQESDGAFPPPPRRGASPRRSRLPSLLPPHKRTLRSAPRRAEWSDISPSRAGLQAGLRRGAGQAPPGLAWTGTRPHTLLVTS